MGRPMDVRHRIPEGASLKHGLTEVLALSEGNGPCPNVCCPTSRTREPKARAEKRSNRVNHRSTCNNHRCVEELRKELPRVWETALAGRKLHDV